MDVRFVNPFILSVQHVFKTMLQTDTLIGKPFIKDHDAQSPDAAAVINFSGDAAGSVILCFPIKTAVKSASTFAGTEITADHEDFADALGELANIIAGRAKAQFEGLSVNISLPAVTIGETHAVSELKQTPTLVLPCDSALGRFAVEVAMSVQKQAEPRASATAGPAGQLASPP